MSRHRLEPPPRVRPRYGRMAAAGLSLVVTVVALLGGLGLLPLQSSGNARDVATASSPTHRSTSPSPKTDAGVGGPADVAEVVPDNDPAALPAASGSGRRVVFSRSAQRVWLVDAKESVTSTYPVSGSLTDNLHPGTYSVYSRARWAVGVQDSGVMQYFVRFAHGPHAAIGFHSIPSKNGTPLQTVAQLGTPQSHGCIRQKLSDALRMWNFADVGTSVVVVA
ncbi:lipoprotein-anchoring transpeptidase ErfK/SrfK [Marmoricola sp. URHA0025 HA25]